MNPPSSSLGTKQESLHTWGCESSHDGGSVQRFRLVAGTGTQQDKDGRHHQPSGDGMCMRLDGLDHEAGTRFCT
jgi:hypothetical protein